MSSPREGRRWAVPGEVVHGEGTNQYVLAHDGKTKIYLDDDTQ